MCGYSRWHFVKPLSPGMPILGSISIRVNSGCSFRNRSIIPSFSSRVILQVEYAKMLPLATFSAQLLIICHCSSDMFRIELGLRRHFAEGCLPNTPVLVQGGSKTTRSASPSKGTETMASATTGSAILVPMRLVSFFHVFMRLAEKSTE